MRPKRRLLLFVILLLTLLPIACGGKSQSDTPDRSQVEATGPRTAADQPSIQRGSGEREPSTADRQAPAIPAEPGARPEQTQVTERAGEQAGAVPRPEQATALPAVQPQAAAQPATTVESPGQLAPRPTRQSPLAGRTPAGRTPLPTVALPDVSHTPVGTVVPAADAQTVVTTYAADVLGIGIDIKTAYGWQGTILRSLSLPSEAEAQLSVAVDLAVASYAAVLGNGAASVSYGSGSITGDVSVDVQSASLGAFSLLSDASMPADAASALALAQATYPGVAGRSYEQADSEGSGYSFYAASQQPVYDRESRQAAVVAEAVLLNVMPLPRGRTVVSVMAGRGDFAALVQP